jgi:hypothetical protein
MCQSHVSSEALGLLRKAAGRGGRLTVPLRSQAHRRKNRYVMELLVAGHLRPVALRNDETAAEQIVYALSEGVPDRRTFV